MRGEVQTENPQFWAEYLKQDNSDIFTGSKYQRGGSFGSFLKGLLRFVVPIVKTAGKAIGKQALHTGAAIATDVAEGRNLKEAAIERGTEGVEKLMTRKRKRASGAKRPQLGKGKRRQTGRGVGKRPTRKGIKVKPPPKKRSRKTYKRKADVFGFY